MTDHPYKFEDVFIISLQFSFKDLINVPVSKAAVFKSHVIPPHLKIFQFVQILLKLWSPKLGISLHCHTCIHFWPPGTQFLQRTISEEKNLFVKEHNHVSLPWKPFSISRSYQVNTATGGVAEVSSEWLIRKSNNDTITTLRTGKLCGLRYLQVLKADVTRQTEVL